MRFLIGPFYSLMLMTYAYYALKVALFFSIMLLKFSNYITVSGNESTAAAETSSGTVNGIHEIIMVLLLAFRVSTL